MRCFAGLALFLVLYFGGCMVLGAVAGAIAGANDPQHSQTAGRAAGAEIVTKYHAIVAVGAGAAAILACSLPTLLARLDRKSEHDEWQRYAEDVERS